MVMKLLRRSTKPIIWIVALAFMGTIFLAWGMNLTRLPAEKGIVGKAAGKDIRDEQYRQVLDYMYYQYHQQNPGTELTDSDARQMRDDAFTTIVDEMLFVQERRRLGLGLPDNELVDHLRRFPPDFLRSNPAFVTEGTFDYTKYQQAMLDPQLGPFWAQVEGAMRPQLQRMKLDEYVVSLTRVTDPEVKLLYESAEQKCKVRYVGVPFAVYANRITAVDSLALEQYYQAHREDYYQGEMAELDYVTFNKNPSAEDTAVVLNELTDLRRQLMDGADFAELTQTYSDEPGASETGGDLGWFGHKTMVAAFDRAAFSLDTGVISEPVLTPFGYHLIKVHEKRKVNDSDQVHASHLLLKVETSGRTLGDLRLRAQQLIEDLDETPFDSLVVIYSLSSRNTGKFDRGGAIRGFGSDKNIEEFAFHGKIGAVSNVIDKDRFYAVCVIKGRYPAGHQPLSEVRGAAEQAVKMKMGADSALAQIQKVEDELHAGKTLSAAAEAADRTVNELDYFGRFEQIPGIGPEPAFRGIVFSLSKENPISPVFKAARMYCIVELIDRTEPDLERYTEQRDSLYQVVLNGKRGNLYQMWHEDLLEKAHVEDFRYQLPGGY